MKKYQEKYYKKNKDTFPKIKKKCLRCKKVYLTTHKKSQFCSLSCSSSHNLCFIKNNPNWGGNHRKPQKRIIKRGYISIYKPNHPFSNKKGYILEHRLVVEKRLGRYLKKGEIIHHLNGIKKDNRPKNLALCSNNTHHLFISKLRKRIFKLEQLLKKYKVNYK